MTTPPDSKRTFWPYGLSIFIVLFIITTISGVVWLSSQRVDLVSEDYYADGIAYQDRIDREQRTRALPEAPTLMLTPDQLKLIVRLPALHQGLMVSGKVHLYRPSDSRLDREVPLAVDAQGQQVIDLGGQRAGRWIAKLLWTVDDLDYYHEFSYDIGG